MRKFILITLFSLSVANRAASVELMSENYQFRLELSKDRGVWKNGDKVKSWNFKQNSPCDLKSFSPFGHLISALKPWVQKKPSLHGEVRINQKTYYLKKTYKQLPGFFNEVEKVNGLILKKLQECS